VKDDATSGWAFLHATGAGCASVVSWEVVRTIPSGTVSIAVYIALVVGIVHAVHLHRKHVEHVAKEKDHENHDA
jgi:hypothetical protein